MRLTARLAIGATTAVLLPLSAAATVSFDLTIDDPGATNSPYYADITSCFAAAAAEWATHFSSDADLQVVVGFTDDGPTANGSSGTTSFVGYDGTTPVYEQGAAAKIRTGVDANGPDPDIQIEINPDYLANNLWFDPDPTSRTTPIPPNRTDAVSVFLHELTHAFAFNGWRDNFDGTLPDYESTFDQLETFDGANFYFNGPLATAYYGGPVPLTYGNINHFGNASPGPGSDLIPDLMNGVVFYYSTRYDISTLDLLAIADTGLPVTNVPVQWNGGIANWSDASQWSTHAIVPNADVPNATFAATIPSGVVTLDIDVTVDSLTLASGATLIGSGNLTVTNADINGDYNISGTTTINIGTFIFVAPHASAASITGTGNLQVDGSLTSDAVRIQGTWTINGSHTIRPNGTSTGTSLVNSLILAGSPNAWTGALDLTDNKLIVEDSDNHANTLATLQNQVATHAITSSTLPANFGLALLDNAITHFTTFGGLPVDADSILISEELLGDANADGHVDLTDLSTILNNFGTTTSAWTSGNFDHAPTIDLTDLSAVLNNFGLSDPNASTSQLPITNYQPPAAPAPEPGSLVMAGLVSAILSCRRRSFGIS